MIFTLATGCRIGEVCGMARNELFPEIREWRIPEGRTKNGMQHSVYLSDLAMEILERQPQHTAMVWPNPSSETGALRRDTLGARLREALPKLKLSFRCHDLRRTCATWLGNEQVDDRVIDRMLNHQPKKKKLRKTYNTAKYNAPAREWWQAGASTCRACMADNVVPLKPRKRS